MPIQKLTQQPQFPRIGKLRKGGAKVDPKRPGADLGEAFRFVADNADVQKEFDQLFGTAPKTVMFMFPPHSHIDEVLVCWYEQHTASRLMKRCDGVNQAQWWDATAGKYSFTPKACDGHGGNHCAACRTTAHIKIWIPQLMRRAFVEVPFSSTWDVIHLQQYLTAFAQANDGTLMGIPFVLSRRKMKVAYVDTKNESKTGEKWLLHVEPHPSWEKRQVAQLLQTLSDAPQLEAPAGVQWTDVGDDDEDDGEDKPAEKAAEAPKAAEPKPQPTPASIRASIAKSGQTWNIAAWRSVHHGVIDMATNYGVTSDEIAAHTVPNDVIAQAELKTHTEALLMLCEGATTPITS